MIGVLRSVRARRPTRAAAWLLALVTPLGPGGCATELVRVSVEPPPPLAPGEPRTVAADALCRVEDDFAHEFVSSYGRTTYGEEQKAAFDARTLDALVSALRGCGVFGGRVLGPADERAQVAACEARLRVESVSVPEVCTSARSVLYHLGVGLLVGIPFCFIWTDREPDLVDRYVLEVGVRGEPPAARYEALARGTLRAQSPQARTAMDGLVEQRGALRDEALRALASRLRADAGAQERLRAQLDEDLPADPAAFLVSEETHAPRARWRTRRLIAWSNAALEGWAAEARAAELREVLTRVQTSAADLSHRAQVLRDEAETLVARGADREASAARELSLACLERVEALRPLLGAVRDELEARAR
ncbi:MAG: hypothetical protein KF878_33025 [Planctomycetes bacterium]|nr:hypothetical protein [Planctomycetota bacterium]